ncbi:MAG: DNA primase large subunit PriL [Methanomassiliicoccales archaeon PtaU1.Bin124]|nr:MAG: DNA primase large subunit PriL [Methanomassiliicoccales archaeon PtaU1.Bin124]
MEINQLARYPFMRSASEFVRKYNVSLEELLSSYFYEESRRRGRQRVLDALEDVKVISNPVGSDEREAMLEILAYPVARILVSCIADDFLIRRYAIAEAKAMNDRLQTEDISILVEVAEDLGVSAHRDDERLSMHFADFLKYTSGLRGKEWKLVNQEVRSGYILLKKDKFARVLEQALAERIEGELPLPVTDDILAMCKADVDELAQKVAQMREKYRSNDFGEISITKFPPCMKKLASMAEKGENMPHAGRFAITTFLFTLGMPVEQIIATFHTSPDFDRSKTEYQVKHITGDGSGKTYTCPECATMRTNGICVDMDELCQSGKIRHPLSYYRIKTMGRRGSPSNAQKEPVKR